MGRRLEIQDFLARIDFDTETKCWNYTGYIDQNGYGCFGSVVGKRRYPKRAHWFSYEHFIGERLDGMHIHHLCENKRCANPDHLVQLDPREHVNVHLGDFVNVCTRGHGSEHWRTRRKGNTTSRYCRECDRLRKAETRAATAVPCVECGNPRLADTGASRRGLTDSGLCRPCYRRLRLTARTAA